jgi:hypothetical protein
LFIAGCARSGTSVLRRLISADPQTAIGIERYIQYLTRTQRLTPDLFDPERFLSISPGDTFYETFDVFPAYREVLERYSSARIRGDKIPRIYDYYPQFQEFFPSAKIVFVLRNLFDVALSFDRRARNDNDRFWPAKRNYAAAIDEWNRSVRNTLEWVDRLGICVVSYENLFVRGIGVDPLSEYAGLDRAALAERLAILRRRGDKLREQNSESLSLDAKLSIFEKADFASYRRLISEYISNPERPGADPVPSAHTPPRPNINPVNEPVQPTRPGRVHGLSRYWDTDFEAFDYQCYPIGSHPLWARGPKPDLAPGKPYVVVLGAASAFGRCVDRPYAHLLQQRLGVPVVNLGYGGTKPGLYLEDQGLRTLVHGATAVVSELMSARGFPSSVVEARNSHSAMVRLRKTAAAEETGLLEQASGNWGANPARPDGWVFADRLYERWIRAGDRDELRQVVHEIRCAYVAQMHELMSLCSGFKLLFWFSQRAPEYTLSFDTLDGVTGGFPHFVDSSVLSALHDSVDAYVELSSRKGLPSKVLSRFTGNPVPLFPHRRDPSLNDYYPSQEMHELAAELLMKKIAPLLA